MIQTFNILDIEHRDLFCHPVFKLLQHHVCGVVYLAEVILYVSIRKLLKQVLVCTALWISLHVKIIHIWSVILRTVARGITNMKNETGSGVMKIPAHLDNFLKS